MKVLSVFGARPQFVKAALVSREFRTLRGIQETVVNTGQHYDALLSDIFLRELEMTPPAYNLEVGSASHAVQTARILEGTEGILLRERPDCVVVYGDTNSTLGGALAAAKIHIPVVHVESGLRSYNRRMPEEVNRVLTDHLSDLLLAPCESAKERLLQEGITAEHIEIVGDVMYDALLVHLRLSERNSTILERLALPPHGYVLCTIHRAENTDEPARLSNLTQALKAVARHIPVVFPAHPRSRKVIESSGLLKTTGRRLMMIDPVGYLDMIALEKYAAVIATDSGGVQKEAFFLEVPCVTLRNETEWTELISTGWNRLAAPDGSTDIADAILSTIDKKGQPGVRPYGDGRAAKKICAAVQRLCSAKADEGRASLA